MGSVTRWEVYRANLYGVLSALGAGLSPQSLGPGP